MSFTKSEETEFRDYYDEFKDDYNAFGIDNGMETPCKRVKNPNEEFYVDGRPYFPYQITKILEYIENGEVIPKQNENGIKYEWSHICCAGKKPNKTKLKNRREKGEKNNPSCITRDHIELAIHSDNIARKKCHLNIQKYVISKQPNGRTKEEDKLKPGPIYIEDIPENIRKTGIFKKKKKNNKKNNKPLLGSYKTKKIRKSRRIKDNIKGGKNKNNKNNKSNKNNKCDTFKIPNCNHKSGRKCFMNYKQIR